MDWSVNSIQYLAMKEVHSTFLECFLKTAANFNKQDDGECPRTDRMLFQPVGIFSWEKKSVFPDSRPAVGIVSFSPRLPLRSKTRMHLQRHGQYIRYISWKNSRITLFSPSSFFAVFVSDLTPGPPQNISEYMTHSFVFPPPFIWIIKSIHYFFAYVIRAPTTTDHFPNRHRRSRRSQDFSQFCFPPVNFPGNGHRTSVFFQLRFHPSDDDKSPSPLG